MMYTARTVPSSVLACSNYRFIFAKCKHLPSITIYNDCRDGKLLQVVQSWIENNFVTTNVCKYLPNKLNLYIWLQTIIVFQ